MLHFSDLSIFIRCYEHRNVFIIIAFITVIHIDGSINTISAFKSVRGTKANL